MELLSLSFCSILEGEGKEVEVVEPVAEQEVAARDGVCSSDLASSDCDLLVDVVGVAMIIFVMIPFNLIVIMSPGNMLCGTLTRKRLSLDGTGLNDISTAGGLLADRSSASLEAVLRWVLDDCSLEWWDPMMVVVVVCDCAYDRYSSYVTESRPSISVCADPILWDLRVLTFESDWVWIRVNGIFEQSDRGLARHVSDSLPL